MPRNGSGIYEVPPGTDGVSGETISSTMYNGYIHDVETDLNAPRPVVAGGTGATSAAAARANLKAEVRTAQVTSYDSHVFESGSFYNDPGATSAPDGDPYVGVAIVHSNVDYITLEVRNVSTGRKYSKQKRAGIWQAWVGESTDDFVNVTGDTMTGALTINATLNIRQNGTNDVLYSLDGGTGTALSIKQNVTSRLHEIALNNGSGWSSLMDWGVSNVNIRVSTASASTSTGALVVAGGVGIGGSLNSGPLFASAATINGNTSIGGILTASTTNISGALTVSSPTASTSTSTGALTVAGGVGIGGSVNVGGTAGANYFVSSGVVGLIVNGVSGGGSPYSQNWVTGTISGSQATFEHLFYTGTWQGLRCYIPTASYDFRNDNAYKAGGGSWADSSDARIKNVVKDYTRGLDEIAQLRPVVYTFKGNDTDAPPQHYSDTATEEEIAKATKDVKGDPTVPYPNSAHYGDAASGKQRVGLLAQEVEPHFPGTITQRNGYIDGAAVTDLRDLDTSELLFALINAVKQLKAEVDALKGAT